MATKKDLVEAYSFSRRRLITAFVSGAPGGREVEPNRPGRTIVGGVALAILLIAGAAVLGILKSPSVVDFAQEDLVSDKDSGADYVVVPDPDGDDGDVLLRPVANITSAMLLFGADVESTDVPHDKIAKEKLGPPIGILEAPSVPPETTELIQDGWTACTGVDLDVGLGIKLNIAETPQVTRAPDVGFVVRSEDEFYLVAEAEVSGDRTTPRAFVYPVPRGDAPGVLPNAASTNREAAVDVPPEWLSLFPDGGPLTLTSFGISREQIGAKPAVAVAGAPSTAQVGDVLVFGEDRYLLTDEGVVGLDAFASEVYDNLDFPGRRRPEFAVPIQQTPAPLLATPERMVAWPGAPTRENVSSEVCALLDTEPGLQPDVRLATGPGPDATADAVRAGEALPSVEDGHGAFVLSGDFDSAGTSTPALVDSRAIRYPLAGQEERSNLGYAEVDDIVVPDTWLSMLVDGVPLSIDAASCPPTSRAQTGACGGSLPES